jgi:hypothetical protein
MSGRCRCDTSCPAPRHRLRRPPQQALRAVGGKLQGAMPAGAARPALAPPKRVQAGRRHAERRRRLPLACEGTALLWRGDFHNARQLLQALARRVDRKPPDARCDADSRCIACRPAFHRHRQAQGQRARVLGMLLIPLEAYGQIALRRAPDVRAACTEAWGDAPLPCVVSLRELQGLVGAFEWRKQGRADACAGRSQHPTALRRVLTGARRIPRPGGPGAAARYFAGF